MSRRHPVLCCMMLQYMAVNVLCCAVLYCVAGWQCRVLCYTVLYCAAVWRCVVLCTMWHYVLQCVAVCCNTVLQYGGTTQCNTVVQQRVTNCTHRALVLQYGALQSVRL